MHREIQIKQFPIVTTHWWPKTRNERFVWENEQYLYRFLPLVHNHVQVIWVRTHIRCVTCVCARSGSRLTEGMSEAWCWRNFVVFSCWKTRTVIARVVSKGIYITVYNNTVKQFKYFFKAPRFRHALRQALTASYRWMKRIHGALRHSKIPFFSPRRCHVSINCSWICYFLHG